MFLKTFFISFFILLLSHFVYVPPSIAHPLDNTDLYLYFYKDADDSNLSQHKSIGYLYINWFQAAALLQREEGIDARDIYELMEYKSVYSSYVLSNLELNNNGNKCESTFVDLPQSEGEYPLSIGARLVFEFTCSEAIQNLKLKNTIFLDLFEYESNFVSIYNGELFLDKAEMNKYYQEAEMSLQNETVSLKKPQNFISTDVLVGPDDPEYSNRDDPVLSADDVKNSVNLTTQINKTWNNMKRALTGNQDFREMGAISILFVIFLLGFLHTIEAGHSKVVLTSAMLHRSMSVKRGLIYSVIFTLTHIGDIIIIGLIFLFINNFVDIYSQFNMLEKFAAYALFFMALYMLFRNIAAYRDDKSNLKSSVSKNPILQPHTHSHGGFDHSHEELFDDKRSYREQIWIGFISGLAPCIFGWSIFMLVISAKKVWLIIPSIISFGFGILIALSLVVFLASALKKPVFNKVAYISEISPIISALILLIYASFLIV